MMTCSYTKLGTKSKLDSFQKKIPITNYDKLGVGGFAVVPGTQTVYTTSTVGFGTQFVNFFAVCAQSTAGSGLPVPVTANLDYRYLIRSLNIETRFTNQGSDMCQVEIYDIVTKQNQNALAGNIQPDTVWDQAMLHVEGPNAGQNNNMLYTTPYMYKEFNDFYWIKKRTTVFLAGGAHHIHKFNHTVNKTLSSAYLEEFDSFRGITTHTMLVAQGMTHDQSLGSVTVGVTTSGPKIDFTWRYIIQGALQTVTARNDFIDRSNIIVSPTHQYGYEPTMLASDLQIQPSGGTLTVPPQSGGNV